MATKAGSDSFSHLLSVTTMTTGPLNLILDSSGRDVRSIFPTLVRLDMENAANEVKLPIFKDP